jgi:hypothetical protein
MGHTAFGADQHGTVDFATLGFKLCADKSNMKFQRVLEVTGRSSKVCIGTIEIYKTYHRTAPDAIEHTLFQLDIITLHLNSLALHID